MSVTATASMIQREIDHGICLLTFDRPESGANIFDAATLSDLDQQLDFIEEEDSLEGVVILSATRGHRIAVVSHTSRNRQGKVPAGEDARELVDRRLRV